MKEIIKIAVVSFHAEWGNKGKNLKRIVGYVESAASEGVNLIIFPELALTSYDDEENRDWDTKMQVKNAETIPGPSSKRIAELSRRHKMYIIFGMPELDKEDSKKVYNAACICGPEGIIGSYRKIHLPYPEFNWAVGGHAPFIFETEWGPMGVSICYDTYCFPELIRYYGAKGCRMHINPTAYAKCHGDSLPNNSLRTSVISNGMYIASANLIGLDLTNDFWGGSSVIGPDNTPFGYEYYVGHAFADNPEGYKNGMLVGTVDLSRASRAIFEPNEGIQGETDYRPSLYKLWMEDLAK